MVIELIMEDESGNLKSARDGPTVQWMQSDRSVDHILAPSSGNDGSKVPLWKLHPSLWQAQPMTSW